MNVVLFVLVPAGVLLAFAVWRAASSPCGWRAWILYQIARVYSPVVFGWRAVNASTIPEDSPAIVISNHASPADPMLLWMGHLRQFRKKKQIRVIEFMTAKEYVEQRNLVGWICRVLKTIPVARSGRDMRPAREALRRLKEGRLVGIFPEGQINRDAPDQQLLPGDTGAAWLALKSRVPVVPIYIRGAPQASTMVRCFIKPARVRVTYGQPIDLSPWFDHRLTQKLLRDVTDVMMTCLAELGDVDPPLPAKSSHATAGDATAKAPESTSEQTDLSRQSGPSVEPLNSSPLSH